MYIFIKICTYLSLYIYIQMKLYGLLSAFLDQTTFFSPPPIRARPFEGQSKAYLYLHIYTCIYAHFFILYIYIDVCMNIYVYMYICHFIHIHISLYVYTRTTCSQRSWTRLPSSPRLFPAQGLSRVGQKSMFDCPPP